MTSQQLAEHSRDYVAWKRSVGGAKKLLDEQFPDKRPDEPDLEAVLAQVKRFTDVASLLGWRVGGEEKRSSEATAAVDGFVRSGGVHQVIEGIKNIVEAKINGTSISPRSDTVSAPVVPNRPASEPPAE